MRKAVINSARMMSDEEAAENSDFLTLHNAFASWRRASGNGIARKFCKTNYLSHQNLQQIEELRTQFLSYLVDSSFIHVDRAFIKELSRARYSRGKTRFVMVPADLDVNSGNAAVVHAALTAGLYPKILAVDPIKGEMRTITNNQPASFHPSSVIVKQSKWCLPRHRCVGLQPLDALRADLRLPFFVGTPYRKLYSARWKIRTQADCRSAGR